MDGAKIKKLLKKHWPILVLVLFLVLRLPSLFEPFTYGDEGIYLTLGQALRAGRVWYRDIHDNKPPLLYLIAALTGEFWAYRAFFFFWSLLTVWTFWQLARLVFAKNKTAPIIATLMFTFLTNLHFFEGNIANAENFMMLPTITAFYLILKFQSKKWSWFLAGFFLSLATLFKIPAAFDLVALLVFAFLSAKKYRLFLSQTTLAITGFVFALGLTFLYYASRGALMPYLKAAFWQNIPYLSSWSGVQAQGWGLPWPLLLRGVLVFLIMACLFCYRRRLERIIFLIILWFSFAWFAALLSSRPYPHYLLQLLPAFALAWGLIVWQNRWRLLPLVLSLVLFFSFHLFHFWHYHNLPYYQNFYQYALGQKDEDDFFAWFGTHTQSLYETSAYLATHTEKEEEIFIWGTQPSIYALAQRLPVGRYTTSYHVVDFDGYQETMTALHQNPPPYLIITGEEERPFPEFLAFLEARYVPAIQFGQIQLFRRVIK